MNKRSSIAIIVPAYNEETVIKQTLQSLLKVVSKEDIYVINDGSSDDTEGIASKYVDTVLTLTNRGKARALNSGIKLLDLADRYEFIMPFDADCEISKDFFHHVFHEFERDKKKEVACVIGKVVGSKDSWITAFRLWEYEIAQAIHKSAQAITGSVIVCPGPSTVYRSEVFKSVEYPTGTVTEDMDFTFLLHRKEVGKIKYASKAEVYTQDPNNIRDYVKQLDRWYTGFWQCLDKHNIPWGGQRLDAEVSLLAIEGLFNSIIVLISIPLIPIILKTNPYLLLVPIIIDLFLLQITTTLYVSQIHKARKILLYIPSFYFLRLIGGFVFLKSFFKFVIGYDRKMNTIWDSSRYAIRKESVWHNPSIQ